MRMARSKKSVVFKGFSTVQSSDLSFKHDVAEIELKIWETPDLKGIVNRSPMHSRGGVLNVGTGSLNGGINMSGTTYL